MPYKLVFFGTPEVAAGTLRALSGAGHQVVHVVTRPDARRGRGTTLTPSPVKAAALELGLPVSHRPADVIGTGADLGVVVAYGRLIKPDVLDCLNLVNVHFSLLPRWRGAAPVERAVLAGDTETGVCLMALEIELDTGPIYSCAKLGIGPQETAAELRGRLGALGDQLLLGLLEGPLPAPSPQVGEPLYADKVSVSELRLDFGHPAVEVDRTVRVGRAWTTFRGKRLIVHRAQVVPEVQLAPGLLQGELVGTADGALRLVSVQPEGRPAMDASAWARGARFGPQEELGG